MNYTKFISISVTGRFCHYWIYSDDYKWESPDTKFIMRCYFNRTSLPSAENCSSIYHIISTANHALKVELVISLQLFIYLSTKTYHMTDSVCNQSAIEWGEVGIYMQSFSDNTPVNCNISSKITVAVYIDKFTFNKN